MADKPVAPPRPLGITAVTVTQVIIGVIDLVYARDYFYWANWRFSYDDTTWGLINGAFGVALLILGIGFFVAATRMWVVGPDAWGQSIRVVAGQLGLVVVSMVVWWDLGTSDVAGFVVSCCLLFYLNTAGVRALFGRGPLFAPKQAS